MPLIVNIRHLEEHDLQSERRVAGRGTGSGRRDEVVQARQPLRYDLEVQKLEDGILVQGRLRDAAGLRVRPLPQAVSATGWNSSDWACHLPLEGAEKARWSRRLRGLDALPEGRYSA